MTILHNVVSAADPAGLIIYAAAMVFFLGAIALATHRDRVIAASKRRRSLDPEHRYRAGWLQLKGLWPARKLLFHLSRSSRLPLVSGEDRNK
jgi:hypothetical protein